MCHDLVDGQPQPARLEIISKLLARIISHKREHKTTFEESMTHCIGDFITVPLSTALSFNSSSDTIQIPTPQLFSQLFQKKRQRTQVEQVIFEKSLRKPFKLLQDILPNDEKANLSDDYVFDLLCGVPLLNCREVRIHSPLHMYFEKIRKSSHSFGFLPLMLKMDTKYGGNCLYYFYYYYLIFPCLT